MKWILGIVSLLIIVAGVLVFVTPAKAPPNNGTATTTAQYAMLDDLIGVEFPTIGATISSPLTITGKARGNFYFEASFPVELTDWDGKIIAQGHATALDDWMTQDYVRFSATLTFTTPVGGDPKVNRGTLLLHNDNPSGDPARDKTLEIPVVFK